MSGQLEQDYLYIGQTWERIVPLRIDGKPADFTGATIGARFTRVAGTYATNNGNEVSCSDSGGSDYACGVIEVVFPEAETTVLTAGTWTLELKVTTSDNEVLIFQCNPSVQIVPTGHAV